MSTKTKNVVKKNDELDSSFDKFINNIIQIIESFTKQNEEKVDKKTQINSTKIDKKNQEIKNLKKTIEEEIEKLKKNIENEKDRKKKEFEKLIKTIENERDTKHKEIEKLKKNIENERDTKLEKLIKTIENERDTKHKEFEKLIKTIEKEIENKNKENEELNKIIENKEKEIENKNKENEELIKTIENDRDTQNKEIEKLIKTIENDRDTQNKENNNIFNQISQLIKIFDNEKKKTKNYNGVNNKIFKEKEIGNNNYLETQINSIKNIISDIQTNYLNKEEVEQKTNCNEHINGLVGLKNTEHNCYMNSVIQVLKNIKEFISEIDKSKSEDNIFQSLKRLLGELRYSNEESVSISEFKRYFSQIYKRFEGRKNNDSTYFLIYLFQYLHKIFNQPNKNITKIDIFNNLNLKNEEKNELNNFLIKYESKNNSFIHDLFFGYQMNKIICGRCDHISISFQSFNILDIPLMDERKKLTSLEECLNCYLLTKDQKGVRGFECSNCNKNNLSHLISILKLPPILIINLKRVGENAVYYHEIEIPFILKTQSIEKLNKLNKIYQLIGFIKHYGNEKDGHNVAYTKNIFNDKWYKFNDEKCKEESNPTRDKSFLLFYQLNKNEKN